MQELVEQLYLRYYRELYRYLSSRCPSPDAVDDIIQSTFLEALKSMDSYQGRSSLKTWLFGIARHQLHRYLRKRRLHLDLEQVPEREAPQADMEDRMLARRIWEAIDRLEPTLQSIMRLRLQYGLSFREIGVRVQRSENYCRVNFYRVKERLRKEFGDEEL